LRSRVDVLAIAVLQALLPYPVIVKNESQRAVAALVQTNVIAPDKNCPVEGLNKEEISPSAMKARNRTSHLRATSPAN
jgi:hypothetical protein